MDDFILEIPNFIPEKLCTDIIKKFEDDNDKKDGYFTYRSIDGKEILRKKYNVELFITYNQKWENIDKEISKYVGKALQKYNSHLHDKFYIQGQKYHTMDRILNFNVETADTGYYIHKIKEGDYYAWHVDNTPNNDRYLQMIFYLNDFDKNEGGCTQFTNGRKVRPEIGKVLIYPCSWTFPHSGEQVKKQNGYKYILTTTITARY